MVVGLMPGMSLTAYAATDTYTTIKNNVTVVQFNGYNWYIIEDNSTSATEGTVTLLAADNSFGISAFSDDNSNAYISSKIKATLDAMTQEGGDFADVADAIVSTDLGDVSVTGAKLYLLSTSEAQTLNSTILNYNFPGSDINGGWWLRSAGDGAKDAACVFGEYGSVNDYGYGVDWEFGVRPALKLNLSSVVFSSNTFTVRSASSYSVTITPGSNMTKTSGEASQTGLSGAMTDVVYTADDGYYFPTDYSVADVNGISVTRNSYTQITVSGTPTADAAITLTAPTAKTTPNAPTTAAAVNCTTASNNDGKLTGVTTAMECFCR